MENAHSPVTVKVQLMLTSVCLSVWYATEAADDGRGVPTSDDVSAQAEAVAFAEESEEREADEEFGEERYELFPNDTPSHFDQEQLAAAGGGGRILSDEEEEDEEHEEERTRHAQKVLLDDTETERGPRERARTEDEEDEEDEEARAAADLLLLPKLPAEPGVEMAAVSPEPPACPLSPLPEE